MITPEEVREEVAFILSQGKCTVPEVAALVKISGSTIYRWLKQPSFVNRVNQLILEKNRRVMAKLTDNLDEIVSVAYGVAMDEEVRPGDRLSAVNILIKLSQDFIQQVRHEEITAMRAEINQMISGVDAEEDDV